MDCVNHSGVNATAYCQSCGKALCEACVRKGSGGQIFCEPCWMVWSTAAASQRPYVPPTAGEPSPGLAAVLGFIPGVGAMYNGQFVKGMVHLVIFAVLVSAAHVYEVFGLFVMGWVFYQVFEAYQTAKARRDGDPLPDPLGLNELSNSIVGGMRPPPGPQQNSQQGPQQGPPRGTGTGAAGAYQAPIRSVSGAVSISISGPISRLHIRDRCRRFRRSPPIPPFPPMRWRRREPVGAVILIALGVLFLLGQFDWFSWHWFHFSWPLLLIGLGVWQIVRRLEDSRGMPPGNQHNGPQNGPQSNSQTGPQDRSQGGQQ